MARHGRKVTLMITLNPDAKLLLNQQATGRNLSMSYYIERLVLEKELERRNQSKSF